MTQLPDVALRVAIVGDSNTVVCAQQIVEVSYARTPAAVPTLDFVAAVSGMGLYDLSQIVARLEDMDVRCGSHDAFLVNLGVNDISFYSGDPWLNYWNGVTPDPHGVAMRWPDRVKAVLDACPEGVPVYWIGVPLNAGLCFPPWHPYAIAAVDIVLGNFDPLTPTPNLDPIFNPSGGHAPDPRFRYLNPDALIGSASPVLVDCVHYAPEGARALYDGAFDRMLEDLT